MKRSVPLEPLVGFGPRRRLAVRAGILTLALGVGGVLAPGAGAKSETLHFWRSCYFRGWGERPGRGSAIARSPSSSALIVSRGPRVVSVLSRGFALL
jgi:hypothetical protein